MSPLLIRDRVRLPVPPKFRNPRTRKIHYAGKREGFTLCGLDIEKSGLTPPSRRHHSWCHSCSKKFHTPRDDISDVLMASLYFDTREAQVQWLEDALAAPAEQAKLDEILARWGLPR